MNSKTDISRKSLRDFMAGSMHTMNLITMFGLACREGGIFIPELNLVTCSEAKAHGKGKRVRAV